MCARAICRSSSRSGRTNSSIRALEGCRHLLAKLRSALRAERRRALSGHWSYDLNRHLGLISAYKGELAGLSRIEAQPNCARRGKGLG